MTTKKRVVVWLGLAVVLGAAWFWFFKIDRHYLVLKVNKVPKDFWGITYSTKYAKELGLDWQEAYLAILDDLQVKRVRIPVYWDEVEVDRSTMDFSDYEYLIEEGEKRDVQFIMVLGRRQPRWPECHTPEWLDDLSEAEGLEEELELIKDQVELFKDYDSITHWQVQNEFFVPWFGICPKGEKNTLEEQISIVRALDDRPILLTDSGEFSLWRDISVLGDEIGTTMYRVAWNSVMGHVYSAWPAWNYSLKAKLNGVPLEKAIVAELQAEPWPAAHQPVTGLTRDQVDESFSLEQFRTNAELARRTGFSKAYLWGAEWWYFMLESGYPEFWEEAKVIFATDD